MTSRGIGDQAKPRTTRAAGPAAAPGPHEDRPRSMRELQRLNAELRDANQALERKFDRLKALNDDLANLIVSAQIAAMYLDRGFRIVRFTPEAASLLRLRDADLGRSAEDVSTLFDVVGLREDAGAVLERLQPVEREVGDRAGRCYARRIAPYRTQDGRIEGVVVTYHDVTQRQRAEQSLKALNDELEARVAERTASLERQRHDLAEQQQLLSTMLGSVAEGIVVVDRDGTVLIENPAALQIVGDSARGKGLGSWCEAVGACEADGRTPLSLETMPTARALKGEEVRDVEFVLRGPRRDRNVVVEISAAPLRDEAGNVVGAIANFRNITERKRAAEAEARLAALVRSTSAAVMTWKTDGRVIDWNDGAARLFGYAPDEICGRDVALLSMAGERREFGGGNDLKQPLYDRELVMRHKDGHPVHVAWTAASVRDASGRVVGAAGVGSDISDRARLERQVAQLADEQRQQLGHDLHDSLGQQLTAIGLLAGALKAHADVKESAGNMIDKLELAIDTAKRQLRDILTGLAPLVIDAAGLVAALQELAESTRRTHGIDCRLDCPQPVLVEDNFAANQLYLICREAVHNAVKHGQPRSIVMRLERHQGLRLTVEDDGVGIVRAESRRGEGLGLRIMRYRCRIIGGMLKIGRGDGGGTSICCHVGDTGQAHATYSN